MVTTLLEPVKTGLQIIRKNAWVPDELQSKLSSYSPKSHLGAIVRDCFKFLPPEMAGDLLEAISSTLVIESSLAIKVIRRNGEREDYGVVGNKVITTVGVGYLVDAWQNIVEMENMKYHGIGTGSTAEANGDSALVTELTTEYNPNSTRATGTTTESTSVIFETVATNTLDGTPGGALREHGLFSAASAGVLWDRTVFAAITLSSGDAIQTTYDMTGSAGG